MHPPSCSDLAPGAYHLSVSIANDLALDEFTSKKAVIIDYRQFLPVVKRVYIWYSKKYSIKQRKLTVCRVI